MEVRARVVHKQGWGLPAFPVSYGTLIVFILGLCHSVMSWVGALASIGANCTVRGPGDEVKIN